MVAADTGLVTPKAPVAGFPNRPAEAGESGGLGEEVVEERVHVTDPIRFKIDRRSVADLANILLGVAGAGEKMEAGALVLAAEEKIELEGVGVAGEENRLPARGQRVKVGVKV